MIMFTIFIFLFLSTITQVTLQSCIEIMKLDSQSVLDTKSIQNGAYTCVYRCHSSDEGNMLIDTGGIESTFILEFCPYYGECDTFYSNNSDIGQFSNGQYYYSKEFLITADSDIFTLTCTFTASENGVNMHNESFVRYLTRNLPILIPQASSYIIDFGVRFSTDFTIFFENATESFDVDNFQFRKALENSYFDIAPKGSFMQLENTLRIVIRTSSNNLVITTFTIQTQSFSPNHIGTYNYAYPSLNLYNGFTLGTERTDYCGISYQYGLVWPGLIHGEISYGTCANLGGFFSSDGQVYFTCGLDSVMRIKSECSIEIDFPVIQIILIPNLNFLVPSINQIISELRTLTALPLENLRFNQVLNSVLQTEFTLLSVKTTNIVLRNMMVEIEDYFIQNMETLSYNLLEIQALILSKTCYCDFVINDDFPIRENIFEICQYRSCDCFAKTNCSCLPGYTGTHKECGIDTDLDGYPDHLLDCISEQNNTFCQQDNCASKSNTDQLDCDMNGMGDVCDGPICPYDTDVYGIVWACGVGNGVLEMNTCFGGVGIAYRECDGDGVWQETDVSRCASEIYGRALSLCNSNPGITIIQNLLQNITDTIIGETFPYGYPDTEAFTNLFTCLSTQASSYTEYTQVSSMVNLLLNAATKILQTFVTIESRFISNVIVDLNRFTKFVKLSNSFTFNTDLLTLYTTRVLNGDNSLLSFSSNGTKVSIPGPLIEEIFQNCIDCTDVSVNILIISLDTAFRNAIVTDNLLTRPNRLSLNYFDQPEIVSDIVSVEFGDVQDTKFIHSYSVEFNTYPHSSSPFQLTQTQSPIFCAKYSNSLSSWVNNIEGNLLQCNYIQSPGFYAQFTGFRHLEDTTRPLNMVVYIGIFISLTVFSTTILLYLLFFKLLIKIAHLINLIMAILFVCFDILFVFTLESTYFSEIACKTSSIFMHYFLTATFIWLTAYTLVCYILISFPHFKFEKKSFVVVFISATISSLVIVFPFTPVYHQDYISNATSFSNSLDQRFGFCWVNTQDISESYYIFLVTIPIIILYFSSCIIIGLTLIKDIVSSFGLKSSKKLLRVLLIYILLFGLSWGSLFAFLSTNNSILAYTCTVLNAFQATFFLFGVVLIPHQEIHQRIEYYSGRNFCKNVRLPKIPFPTTRRRKVTQAELAIRAQHEPIIETTSKENIEDSGSDILSGSVDFSKLLKGEKVHVVENEIDIMDPATFAPAELTGEPAPSRKPSRLKVLPEIETESDISQSEDSRQQELAIYYPVSISSTSMSDTNQIDSTKGKLLDNIIKSGSGEMVDQSEVIVHNPAKFADIVNMDSFDEQTPPLTIAKKKPNKVLAFWEKKIIQMNKDANKSNIPKARERLSIPAYTYPDQDLEEHYFRREPTRMMLPSGRMVTATPPPSEPDDNYASSMPELIYLQSRSFSPDMFDRLRKQASNELHEMESSQVSNSYTVVENEEESSTSSGVTLGEIELVADLDTLVNQIDIHSAKSLQ